MSELIGRTLGPYHIVEQLGMGGMATVYKAYQSNMDRNVAVKVLPRHFAQDPTFVGRFEQEAKVIARLEHARVLPVYDFGETDGVTYIVMRYLDAGTLSELIHAGRIPLAETTRILTQVSEGLDYAHKKGVIHRDIKPSNIMLDSNGDAYITDFGISKLIEGTAQFTGSGIVGTPDYVSPEQALGQPLDYRSDIYSLGIVLYQMVTNDVPFHAETPMAVIIKHIHEPLPMPRSLVPDLPESVENVILKALAKNPDDRYQTCGELARALNAALGGAQIPAPELTSSRLPTSLPSPTRPVGGYGDSGTMPVVPSPGEPQPTSPAQKKGAGLGTTMLIVGALVVIGVIGVVILLGLRNARDRKDANGTATAVAAGNAQPVAAAPTKATGAGGQKKPTATPGAADTGRIIFEDRFESGSLKPAWDWVNKPAQGGWQVADGHLSIDLLPNTQILEPQTSAGKPTAPALVVPVPRITLNAAYSIQVDVTIHPTADREQAGIIILDDSGHPWITLVRAFCSTAAPACSGDAIYLDDWRTFVINPSKYQSPQAGGGTLPADGTVTLRLTVQSRRAAAAYSTDGGNTWHTFGAWPMLLPNQVGSLGLVASAEGSANSNVQATFDNFVVTPAAQ